MVDNANFMLCRHLAVDRYTQLTLKAKNSQKSVFRVRKEIKVMKGLNSLQKRFCPAFAFVFVLGFNSYQLNFLI